MGGRRARLLAALVLPLALVACGGGSEQLTGAVLSQPYAVPATSLTDTSGTSYSLSGSTDKRLTLVFFGYTHCPDICGLVMSSLASAMTRLDAADRRDVDVIFVTTDPQRDTPTVLRDYLERFDPSFIGLTGSLSTIVSIGDRLHVAIERGKRLPSGGYDVVHGTSVLGIDGKNRVPIVWTEGTSAAQFASDIHQLLA